MVYKIIYSLSAEKYLSRLTISKASAILKRITYVATDPFRQDNNIVKLAGTLSSYRLRIGDIRLIYQVDTKVKIIYVVKIAPRGAIYS
ncbi:type II toxin-antitoxin system RelE/ParE family toxin [Candidatus Roizmanbacteria bacterium]|nr:type II toxin-antitoxin system RelE/ParE family toxin [Candidatus Roizmanbacteria bacterium]